MRLCYYFPTDLSTYFPTAIPTLYPKLSIPSYLLQSYRLLCVYMWTLTVSQALLPPIVFHRACALHIFQRCFTALLLSYWSFNLFSNYYSNVIPKVTYSKLSTASSLLQSFLLPSYLLQVIYYKFSTPKFLTPKCACVNLSCVSILVLRVCLACTCSLAFTARLSNLLTFIYGQRPCWSFWDGRA